MQISNKSKDSLSRQSSSESPLKIAGLSHCYQEADSQRSVLKELSIEVKPGEVVAILGRSGCGKSTLLNLISGIEATQIGSIQVGALSLSQMSEADRTLFRRRHIGFIYQSFNLFPTLNVFENVAAPLELNGAKRAEINNRVDRMLKEIELSSHANKYPETLSGGEQQRVAIARALIHQPSLILADEPTGNLDAEIGEKILQILTGSVQQNNATMLLVTHSLNVAKRANRILTLENGQLQERTGSFAW